MKPVVIGNATLYLGDCREVLPHLGGSVAIVSDPPYGIGFVHSGSTRTSGHSSGVNSPNNAARIVGDDEPFKPGHLLKFEQALLFGADHYAQELPRGRWLACEVCNVVPVWVQRLGLTRPWCRVQDAWRWLRLW